MKERDLCAVLRWIYLALVLLFVFAPAVTLVFFSFQEAKIQSFPITRYSTNWYIAAWDNADIRDGFRNSVVVGFLTVVLSTFFGFVSAHVLSRGRIRAGLLYMTVVSLPVVVPLLLSGMAMLMFFNKIHFEGTFLSIVIAHTCYCSPFALGLIRGPYQQLNVELEQAARNLGASPFQVILRVVIPQLWPAIAAAATLSFLVSWDEFILAWFVGGFTKTLPVVIYGMMGTSFNPSLNAVGSMTIGLSALLLFVVFVLENLTRRTRWAH